VASATGLNVPIIGNGPAFAPQPLSTPVGKAPEANFYAVSSMAPPSLDKPAVLKATQDFANAHPDEKPGAVSTTYAVAAQSVTRQVLAKACANRDLTRQGLVTALHQLSNVDTGGLVAGPMDFSKVGQPSTRAVYIAKVDSSQLGGLKSQGVFQSANAKTYQEGQ
jgi:hypothetical protein